MPNGSLMSPDRIADHFVNYLFDEYQGSKHVRRVASWIGFVVMGIDEIDGDMKKRRARQLQFEYGKRHFKAKYDHKIGGSGAIKRGGIKIVEVLAGRGKPEGETVVEIKRLEEAAEFYLNAPQVLAKFVRRVN